MSNHFNWDLTLERDCAFTQDALVCHITRCMEEDRYNVACDNKLPEGLFNKVILKKYNYEVCTTGLVQMTNATVTTAQERINSKYKAKEVS